MLSFWIHRLNLTPEQQEQAKPIAADLAQQIEVLHEQSINQFLRLGDLTDDRLSRYLTPDQKMELDKVRKERQKDFGHHGLPTDPQLNQPSGP
jgi:hypothetical protein